MGNFFSREYLKFDRLIDGENKISIGIVSKNQENSISGQAIQVGSNGKIKRLEKFTETQNSLIFEFEHNTVLSLIKRDKCIIIHLKQPDTHELIKIMDSIIRTFFNPINFGEQSYEFDKIPGFISYF